ncbi:MAG: succinate dehydrogenase, cytochrome b556 subunit, partial [Pseudomonadota bacterium]|nr:succinate dehydrogenase, cytochrome b556 subunit [Pseudomonadota bacterium]
DAAFATAQGFFGSVIGVFVLLCWAAALIFHLCTGIRHLIWDVGLGFDNHVYRVTGWGVIATAVALTLIVWIIALVVW